ncbi:hypothetical protein [Aquimarina spongiae]|uniref:Uncharacterized protein n=1 Tax=Aquimarina spongiae TaxID=570521 RepID=A0A1M6I1G7_9FLAO|nr:hypothetical protein [Aquimarina spongiae]SHJ28306.1 hypothetical protein SAMN04488508_10756 [Aquimarina spongiae]
MLNWFKKNKKPKSESEVLKTNSDEYSFRWFEEEDPDNPFNKRILDISPYTTTAMAFTKEKAVAEKYNELRASLGKELIEIDTSGFDTTSANLQYPHNGEQLEGIAFKADSMDCKWDIYAYDNYLFFSRSWDGRLVYKAKYTITTEKISIPEIQFENDLSKKEAINDVHFLIKTHAVGQAFPHMIPKDIKTEAQIAQWSFSKFGNRAYYACYDDITDTLITSKK